MTAEMPVWAHQGRARFDTAGRWQKATTATSLVYGDCSDSGSRRTTFVIAPDDRY